ncbi:MAG: hypothetical protein EB015_12695 [Methylocystaceae bacterium]|nr:hypothetical protein [Methylocystaceae bacterium]
MARITKKFAYLALGEGFNDEKMRFESILRKRKLKQKLTAEETAFYKRKCVEGMTINNKRLQDAFDRHFDTE